jgi:beta-glucanase (GH16 family)
VDLSNYHLTFDDEFNSLSASSDGKAFGTTWTNHMWYPGNPGGVEKIVPDAFGIDNGVLHIHTHFNGSEWTSGVLSSVNSQGVGFVQEYGYFEMRAKLSGGSGAWPSFWLMSNEHIKNAASSPSELDVIETDGAKPNVLIDTTHSYADGYHWQNNNDKFHVVGDTSSDFHTYGLKWTPQDATWYFDGQPIQNEPTQPDQHVPMAMIANLGLGIISQPDPSHPPSDMQIDWIHAYQSNDWHF